MAIITIPRPAKGPMNQKIPFALSSVRGQTIAQKRVNKPSSPKTTAQRNAQDWLRQNMKHFKRVGPAEKQSNANVAPQLRMLERDFWLALASGTLFAFTTPTGQKVYGTAWHNWLTKCLDTIIPGYGAMPIRTEIGWTSPATGTAGEQFHSGNYAPGWSDQAKQWGPQYQTVATEQMSAQVDALGDAVGSIIVRCKDGWGILAGQNDNSRLIMGAKGMPIWEGHADNPARTPEDTQSAAYQGVNAAFDSITIAVGSMVYRTADHWRALHAGDAGDVLTADDEHQPVWVKQ